jgi:putative membrane protein
MRTDLLTTAFAAAFALAACGPQDQAATPPTETTADAGTALTAPVDPAAKTLEFATKAANTDMLEIEASKAALTKTKNTEVKKLAQAMITDSTKTSAELKQWASTTTVALPATLDGMDKSKAENIATADATGFDDKYLDTLIDAHEEAINSYRDYSENGQEPGLKAWAIASLPKLTENLETAKALRDKVNAAENKAG